MPSLILLLSSRGVSNCICVHATPGVLTSDCYRSGGQFRDEDRAKLEQSQMVRILGLQRTHQDIKFRKTGQILETKVFQKKRPACKSAADTSLKPFKGRPTPLQ